MARATSLGALLWMLFSALIFLLVVGSGARGERFSVLDLRGGPHFCEFPAAAAGQLSSCWRLRAVC